MGRQKDASPYRVDFRDRYRQDLADFPGDIWHQALEAVRAVFNMDERADLCDLAD